MASNDDKRDNTVASSTLRALGIASNTAPDLHGPLRAQPAPNTEGRPAWRIALENEKAVTTLKVKVAERPSVTSMYIKRTDETLPIDKLKLFPNLARLRVGVAEDAHLIPLLECLAQLKSLIWLELFYVHLQLPAQISRVRTLRRLEVDGDWAVQRGPQTLPEELCELPILEELQLKDGRLTGLPENIGQLLHLRLLDIRGNPSLARLPTSFRDLAALRSLFIGTPTSLVLSDTLPILTQLPELRALHFRAENTTELPELIGNLPRIEWLNIGSSLRAIPEVIAQLVTLRSLDLEFNELRVLPDALTDLPALERLNLFQNPDLDLTSAIAVISRCPSLRAVRLPAQGLSKADARRLQDIGFGQSSAMYGDMWVRGDGPLLSVQAYL